MMKSPQEEQYRSAPGHTQTNTLSNNKTHRDGLQEALVRALYDDWGLDGLATILANYINGCTSVYDLAGAQLSLSFSETISAEQKKLLRQAITLGTFVSSGTDNDFRDALGVYSLVVPLGIGGENIGTLSVVRCGIPFSEDDRKTLGCTAGLFCVQLAQNKKVAEIELRLKGNFIEDLISSRFSDPESILNRARALDYNIQTVHRVLVAEIENNAQLYHHFGNDQKAVSKFKTDMIQLMQSRLNEANKGMVICSKDTFILLVQQKYAGGKVDEFKALAERIVQDAASQLKAKLFIGIGSACKELADFSKSYIEAKKALEIGEYMITEGQVRSFEQFKVHALFLSTLKPADLYNYAYDQLESLLVYDEKHQTDFLKTLQEFLYLRNNVEGTARTLNMSVSGLKYRLQKIERIIGLDLKDYKVCFDLQLALVILQLFGEYRIKEKS